jgi:hypothetical protein
MRRSMLWNLPPVLGRCGERLPGLHLDPVQVAADVRAEVVLALAYLGDDLVHHGTGTSLIRLPAGRRSRLARAPQGMLGAATAVGTPATPIPFPGFAALVEGRVHGIHGSPILETVVSISIRILPTQPSWFAEANTAGVDPRWPRRGLVRWQRCDRRLRERQSGGSRDWPSLQCSGCSGRGSRSC